MKVHPQAPLLLVLIAVYLGVTSLLWTFAPAGHTPSSDPGGTGTAGTSAATPAAAADPLDPAPRTRLDPSGPLRVVRVEDRVSGECLPGANVTWREDPHPERMATHAGRVAEIALAEQNGPKLVADGQGLVRVPASRPVLLVGRFGDRYGDMVLPRQAEPAAAEAPVQRLRLDRDLTLRIAVLDHREAPAAGVAIEILPPDETVRGDADPLAFAADDEGRILVAHWQDLARDRLWVRGVVERLLVRGRIPGVVGEGVAFAPADPPAELVLRLPPTGRIAVQALDDTRPLPHCDLTLQVVPGDGWSDAVVPEVLGTREWTVPTSAEGRAVFERVVLGARFRAQLRAGAVKASEVFCGPLAARQEVAVTLRAVAESCVLTGRALDPGRAPLGDAGLRFVYATEAGSGSRLVATDGDGRFEVNLGHAAAHRALQTAEFSLAEHRSAAGLGLAHRLEPRPLQPGVFDLGDLVLDGAAALASGRILPAGASTAAVELVVERRCELQHEVCWESDPLAVIAFPGADRFEVRGQARSDLYRLRLVSRHCLPIDPIEFARGAQDLEIEVQPGGDLRAVLRVAPGLCSEDFAVALRPVAVAASATTLAAAADRLQAEIHAADESLHCSWRALWPGSYAVEVRSVGSDALLADSPVRVEAAAQAVADIDLRGLHVIRLHVAGNDQQVVPDGPWSLVLADDERPGGARARIGLRRGIARIASERPYADVLVMAEGFLPQRLRAVPGDNRVSLEPLPSVSIRVQRAAARQRPVLALQLERLGATGSRSDAAALTIATNFVEVDSTGTAAVPLAIDGRYRVVVFQRQEDRWVRVDDVLPDEVIVAATSVAQSFDVRIAR